MLISKVSEEEGRDREGDARVSTEYQTADELFEIMTKENNLDINDDLSLSTRDLVILYKNIDVGTKIMAGGDEHQRKIPNQHVESIVYKDDRESDDSDASEFYDNSDLQDVFLINTERIDLINNMPSLQHTLCHKYGDLEIKSSNFNIDYDRQFLFKDPYIKQQLKNINIMPDTHGLDTILPASLLDYICCKRLEDNYNFYMDNIIRYVQHTIEQLKRISNGDYLTDRAREKWREVEKEYKVAKPDATKVLATSISIPLHVEGKVNGHRSTWDDIVHSEVDVRSLSKILERKIVIEVPKLICGSYRLFSERHADNLIISCKKHSNANAIQTKGDGESRVDVVFQLKRSESGHVISNINSIMILQKIPSITVAETSTIQCQQIEILKSNSKVENNVQIVEIDDHDDNEKSSSGKDSAKASSSNFREENIAEKESLIDTTEVSNTNNYYLTSSQSSIIDKGLLNKKIPTKELKAEMDFALTTPDELRYTIQRLNMQAPVLEESEETSLNKKKSPTRVRVKSPYENKSFFMEEKKRKKLLEIREKREKKKMALNDNCKVTKHKYTKSAVMAQPSSSVTKLSITNKSFYNSIYGESLNHETAISKKTRKWQRKEPDLRQDDCSVEESSVMALIKGSFEDGNTETVTQMQMNPNVELCTTPISAVSNYDTNSNQLSRLIASSSTDCDSISEDDSNQLLQSICNEEKSQNNENEAEAKSDAETSLSLCNLVPSNTPKAKMQSNKYQDEMKKVLSPVECRKSIDKIYELMKKLSKLEEGEKTELSKQNINIVENRRSSTIQISDSGTSVKHHVISSNPSSFSFEKNVNLNRLSNRDKKKKEAPVAVVPKVIISTKLQTSKGDADRNKNRKHNVANPSAKVPENPLKAISQLLHEFDNVQKTRHKTHKKTDNYVDNIGSRQGSSKKPRQEQLHQDPGNVPLRLLPLKDKRFRPGQSADVTHIANHIPHNDDRHVGRTMRRHISDIIDEAKEARGEAVRGPPRPYSRLNTLAQPKKTYIQAHNEEYQNRNGKNVLPYRMQRLTTSTPVGDKNIQAINARNRRRGSEIASMPSPKAASSVPPIERIVKTRRSASNSPTRKRITHLTNNPPGRQSIVPETPETLKKKMVAVESYVKSHFGLETSSIIGREVQKSRVPLIPNDIELASVTSSPTAEESTALGKKLHYMIDTMINTKATCLSILPESKESKFTLGNDDLEKITTDSLLNVEGHRSESDYPVDIFEDKNIETAVGILPGDKTSEEKVSAGKTVQSFSSATELRTLQSTLYHKMSVSTFPKRLRIKNLTLTPKQSLQQVIVVQSGDTGSLLLKTSLSQNLRTGSSKTDTLKALKPLAPLSNTHINWGPSDIPIQVATIGYAFPTFQSIKSRPTSPGTKMIYKDDLMKRPENEINIQSFCKSHKTSQCFKGCTRDLCTEQSTQVDIITSVPSISNINTNTSHQRENIEFKLEKCKTSKDIVEESKTLRDSKGKETKEESESHVPKNIDHSTSLDILMGLLNEIKKITGESVPKNIIEENERTDETNDLEIILNNAVTQESSVDNNCNNIVAVASLDNFKQLNSHSSTYSFKILNNNIQIIDSEPVWEKPQNLDKEVSADIEKHYVNRLTDVPSRFFSVTITNDSKVNDNDVEVISNPSTQSEYFVAEYETIYCNSFDRILELPKEETTGVITNEVALLRHPKVNTTPVLFGINNFNEFNHLYLKNEKKAISDETNNKSMVIFCTNKITNSCCFTSTTEFDSIMKMKRDILVTVYSCLVFTVFAALSFPIFFY